MQLKWTSSPRKRGLENFEVRPSLSTIQIYSSSHNASLCSAPAPDQMGPRQRSWARFASPQHGQSEPQSVGRSGGAGAQGSGCKMPMFMSVLYGRSRIDCGFDATQDSNLEFRIADSRAWIAKSEFSGSIGKSCITLKYKFSIPDTVNFKITVSRYQYQTPECGVPLGMPLGTCTATAVHVNVLPGYCTYLGSMSFSSFLGLSFF